MPGIQITVFNAPFKVRFGWMFGNVPGDQQDYRLANLVTIALNTDRRALPDDVLPQLGSDDLRGWWGDTNAQAIWGGWPIGTRLWLLKRVAITDSNARVGSTIERARRYIQEAMDPIVAAKIASQYETNLQQTGQDKISGSLTVYRGPKNAIAPAVPGPLARLRGLISHAMDYPEPDGVRSNNAAYITGKLQLPVLPNGEVRVLADANAGNAHLNLQYLDWLATQLLPDTSEDEFLDKWATIFLVNADGSRGRKSATYAAGTATISGIAGSVLPQGAQLTYGNVGFETTTAVTVGAGATPVPLRALDAGTAGNVPAGATLALSVAVAGITSNAGATVVSLTGGTEQENNDDLRARLLARIRLPPMGGDADDYVQWGLRVAGVTRVWCSPRELGLGTVTVRFMCDDLRASAGGIPNSDDIAAMQAYLDGARPVTADVFAVAPIPEPINFSVGNLSGGLDMWGGAIGSGVAAMLRKKAAPGSSVNGLPVPAIAIPSAWVNSAIYMAVGGLSFDLTMADHPMPTNGSLAVLGMVS